jgi:hypothetical protein
MDEMKGTFMFQVLIVGTFANKATTNLNPVKIN